MMIISLRLLSVSSSEKMEMCPDAFVAMRPLYCGSLRRRACSVRDVFRVAVKSVGAALGPAENEYASPVK
jgi:hypothetical protein